MSEIVTKINNFSTNPVLIEEEYMKFDNVFGELEFFKKKCEVLDKDLFKSQTLNKKNDAQIKKLQDMIAVYGKNTNNTSNSFLLPSEFKSNWESLGKDLIMEGFENVFDNNIILANMVQDTMKCIYEEAQHCIKSKISLILNSLNITEPQTEKFIIKFRLIFQEYFSVIFICSDEFCILIQEKMTAITSNYKKEITFDKEEDINKDIQSKSYKSFIQFTFKLCIYMLLHDPPISLNLQPYLTRQLTYHYYNKTDFINIEGFGKDGTPCLEILPPPLLRSNFSYQGIKPSVYIISNSDPLIKAQCEKNKPNTPKVRSYSSAELSGIINVINCQNTLDNSNKNLPQIPIIESKFIEQFKEIPTPVNKSNFFIILGKIREGAIDNSNKSSPKVHNSVNKSSINNSSSLNLNKTSFYSPTPTTIFITKIQKMDDKSKSHSNFEDEGVVINEKEPDIYSNNENINSNLNANLNNFNKQQIVCGAGVTSGYKKQADNKNITRKLLNGHQENSINNNLQNNSGTSVNNNEPLKNYRSNSHNNVKNPSRNSSILESFNNSLNKDSVRTQEGATNYQKTSRTNKTPIPGTPATDVEGSETISSNYIILKIIYFR